MKRGLIKEACSCCGLELSSVYDKTASPCCSQCGYVACKQCTRRGMNQDLCKICHTERYRPSEVKPSERGQTSEQRTNQKYSSSVHSIQNDLQPLYKGKMLGPKASGCSTV